LLHVNVAARLRVAGTRSIAPELNQCDVFFV
jgi:hypothetical protein